MSILRKKRILIVDDEERFTTSLKSFLERTGIYEVCVNHRGSEALKTARRFRPDLLLLDVMMPDMDGGDVAAEVLADEDLKDTPIVFLTAAVTRDEIGVRGTTTGGYPCMAKPVSTEELMDCIRQHTRG